MDAVVILIIALYLAFSNKSYVDDLVSETTRETRLNPDFYIDENAFKEVCNELLKY